MDIQIFDNFEEDGQLTLFGLEEDYEELRTSVRERKEETASESITGRSAQEKPAAGAGEQFSGRAGAGIRIRSCSSCGKLLFVREEDGGYVSACNACGIQYIQK